MQSHSEKPTIQILSWQKVLFKCVNPQKTKPKKCFSRCASGRHCHLPAGPCWQAGACEALSISQHYWPTSRWGLELETVGCFTKENEVEIGPELVPYYHLLATWPVFIARNFSWLGTETKVSLVWKPHFTSGALKGTSRLYKNMTTISSLTHSTSAVCGVLGIAIFLVSRWSLRIETRVLHWLLSHYQCTPNCCNPSIYIFNQRLYLFICR